MTITIEFEGEPKGKERPRSRVAWTKDGCPFVAVTRQYETALAWAAKAAMRGRPRSKARWRFPSRVICRYCFPLAHFDEKYFWIEWGLTTFLHKSLPSMRRGPTRTIV
jgi:hypothetical protein